MIQRDVLSWIYEVSNVSETGSLCSLELARALCALDKWVVDRYPGETGKYPGLERRMAMPTQLPRPIRPSFFATMCRCFAKKKAPEDDNFSLVISSASTE